MSEDGLSMFNKDGSSVEIIGAEHSPGMEMHNGTLGIGLSTAAGIAYGRKLNNEKGQLVYLCQMVNYKRDKFGRLFKSVFL